MFSNTPAPSLHQDAVTVTPGGVLGENWIASVNGSHGARFSVQANARGVSCASISVMYDAHGHITLHSHHHSEHHDTLLHLTAEWSLIREALTSRGIAAPAEAETINALIVCRDALLREMAASLIAEDGRVLTPEAP